MEKPAAPVQSLASVACTVKMNVPVAVGGVLIARARKRQAARESPKVFENE